MKNLTDEKSPFKSNRMQDSCLFRFVHWLICVTLKGLFCVCISWKRIIIKANSLTTVCFYANITNTGIFCIQISRKFPSIVNFVNRTLNLVKMWVHPCQNHQTKFQNTYWNLVSKCTKAPTKTWNKTLDFSINIAWL